MKPHQLIAAIREAFEQELKEKTGWGRTEVMVRFEIAIQRALLRFIEE